MINLYNNILYIIEIINISMSEKGILYCLYNVMYCYYGENVYKLGCTNNLKTRLAGYCTSYIEPSIIICSTNELRNYNLA